MTPLLEVRNISKTYLRGGGVFADRAEGERFTALDGVSFEVAAGETFAIVGESGCGKTTLGRMILRLIEADSGKVWFDGRDLLGLSRAELRRERRKMQMIFQDPYASLDPRMKVGEIVGEPLAIHEPKLRSSERRQRAEEI